MLSFVKCFFLIDMITCFFFFRLRMWWIILIDCQLKNNLLFLCGLNLKQKMMFEPHPCSLGPDVFPGHPDVRGPLRLAVLSLSMSRVLPRTWLWGQAWREVICCLERWLWGGACHSIPRAPACASPHLGPPGPSARPQRIGWQTRV